MYTAEKYAEILRSVLSMNVMELKDEWEKDGCENEFHEGIIRGMEIAIEKIDKSAFLYKEVA